MPRAVLQAVLGLDIAWRHAERLPAGRHVMVSNHATTGDLMVLYSLPRRCVHLVNAALPARVTQARPLACSLAGAFADVTAALTPRLLLAMGHQSAALCSR